MIEPTLASHPDADALASYALGRMALAEMDRVERHLEGCDACGLAVECPPEDTLLALLRDRGAGAFPTPEAHEGAALVPGLNLPSSFETGPGAATMAEPPSTRGRPSGAIPAGLVDHPRYRVESVLGSGGMGTVFLAEHRLMERPVALKVIRPDLVQGAGIVDRFRREARAAARLDHPNIVTAYDAEQAGETPMLVMEFVEGTDLAHHVRDAGPLPAAEACDCARQAALGLQHAHEQGMVHRDIKPQNLMRTPEGRIKILDFGLARFASELAARGGVTAEGAVLGSADTIAPEQANDPRAADIRSDLYSLGCTLYFLLAGQMPHPSGTLLQKLAAHANAEPRPLREIRPDLPPGLVAVVSRMMAKNPKKRYQTPAEAAEALAPFAERIDAGRRSGGRRWPWIAAAAAASILVGAFALTVLRIQTPDGLLVVEVDDPGIQVDVEDGGKDVTIHGEGVHKLRLSLGKHQLRATRDGVEFRSDRVTVERDGKPVATVHYTAGAGKVAPIPEPLAMSDTLDRLDPANIPAAERFAWQPKELVAVLGEHRQRHWGSATLVVASPDGRRYASAGDDLAIRVWDADSMAEVAVLKGHTDGINVVAFSKGGKQLLSCASHGDRSIRLWDAATGAEIRKFEGHGLAVQSVAFSPDGTRILSTSQDQTMRVWDAGSGRELRQFGHGSWVWAGLFAPDGKSAFSGSSTGKVRQFDLGNGKEIRSFVGHKEGIGVRSLAVSPDGKRLLSGSDDGSLRLWDAHTGEELHSSLMTNDFHDLAFSEDGRRAIARSGNSVLVIDGETGAELWTLDHGAGVAAAAFSADGRRVLTGGNDASIRLWDAETGKDLKAFTGHADGARGLAFAPDGRHFASASDDNTVRLWDVEAGAEVRPIVGPIDELQTVAFSADGRLILAGGYEKDRPDPGNPGVTTSPIRVWDAATGKEVRRFGGHTAAVKKVAFLANSLRALSGGDDDILRLWDVGDAKPIRQFPGHTDDVQSLAVSDDRTSAISGGSDGSLRQWDLAGGRELRRMDGHNGRIASVATSRDGRRALSGGADKVVRVWDLQTGEVLRKLEGHAEGVTCVAFAPDGQVAFSGGDDRVINRWRDLDAAEPRKAAFAAWHTKGLRSLALSPDGETLASSDSGGGVVVWEAATGRKLREFQFPGSVTGLEFAPDGRHLGTANGNGTAYILRIAKAAE